MGKCCDNAGSGLTDRDEYYDGDDSSDNKSDVEDEYYDGDVSSCNESDAAVSNGDGHEANYDCCDDAAGKRYH